MFIALEVALLVPVVLTKFSCHRDACKHKAEKVKLRSLTVHKDKTPCVAALCSNFLPKRLRGLYEPHFCEIKKSPSRSFKGFIYHSWQITILFFRMIFTLSGRKLHHIHQWVYWLELNYTESKTLFRCLIFSYVFNFTFCQ